MPSHEGAILVLNAGSSSLKLAVFEAGTNAGVLLRGDIQNIAQRPRFRLHDADARLLLDQELPAGDRDDYLRQVLDGTRAHLRGRTVVGAGHRVVHGGPRQAGPARVTPALLDALKRLIPLAPLHQGHDLAPIGALAHLDASLPQVACFDTAFHLNMPDASARFAIPRALHDQGIRRFGAHGLSYQFIAERLRGLDPGLAAGRVIVAHLGSGASLCAMQDGRSIDTTMGLTPLDGLVMATRCGAIDPGAVLFLLQEHGMDAPAVQDLLYHRSGLLGASGISGDMRDLLHTDDPAAREAVALFVTRLAKDVAGMAASLGGIDGLVFTGGIGQHQPEIRSAACERLRFLGVAIDPSANDAGRLRIDAGDSRVAILVLATDEEDVIARQTRDVLGHQGTV